MDYPSNSHKATAPAEEQVDKKIESVVTNGVTRRKKPLSKRFAETFIGGDANNVMSFVVFEVLVPAAKDTIADAFSQGVERMLFGEVRSSSRRGSSRSGYGSGNISYNRMSQGGGRIGGVREEPRRELSRKARQNHEFDDIVLATRHEAEHIIQRLYDILAQYEVATIADLYALVGISATYLDGKWGWADLQGASVTRVREGFVLDLPRPEPVE